MGLFNKKSVQLSDSLNQATAQALDGLSAVSYTHLDVYKRQRLCQIPEGYRSEAAPQSVCRFHRV